MPGITSKRIGYLRIAPETQETLQVSPVGPIKAMWRKLHAEGYLHATATKVQRFWLSAQGKEALENYDAKLSEACRAVLNAVKADDRNISSMKGLSTVIEAGLVRVIGSRQTSYRYRLTDAGERLADPIGETGYFTKSGNKVKVTGVVVGTDGKGMLEVVRVDGESKGKGMHIPRRAFVRKADWPADCED